MKLSIQSTIQGAKAVLQTSAGTFDVLIDKVSDVTVDNLRHEYFPQMREYTGRTKSQIKKLLSKLRRIDIADAFTTALLSSSIHLSGPYSNANYLSEWAQRRASRRGNQPSTQHSSNILADEPVLINLRDVGKCPFSWNPRMDMTRTVTVDDSPWYSTIATKVSGGAGALYGLIMGGGFIGAAVGMGVAGGAVGYLTKKEKTVTQVLVRGVSFKKDGEESYKMNRDLVVMTG